MNQNTPIQSFANHSKLDRTGEALGPVWVVNPSTPCTVSREGPFVFTGANTAIPSSISNLIESCSDRLFISTSSFSDSGIIQAVEDALRRSVRIYMLVDTKSFDSVLSNPSCGAIIGNILLRERPQRGLDLVISDWHLPTAQGFIMTTPLDGTLSTESNGWALELDKNQIDELSKHVHHEFWSNKAPSREVLSADEARNPVEIAQAPAALSSIFNGDYVLRSSVASDGDDSMAEATLLKEKTWQGQFIDRSNDSTVILHGKTIQFGNGSSQKLYSSPLSIEASTGLFAHSGIVLELAIGAESYLAGWDRTASGNWHSILRLTADQAKAAKSLLQKFSKAPEWVGHSKIKLGDAGNKIIRNGKEMEISDSQTHDLKTVHLPKMPDTIKDLQDYRPALKVPKDSLARQCEFKWISAPPVTPASASEDVLHAEWTGVRDEISKRLNTLDELNVVSKIPGFGRKAKELQKSIDEAIETLITINDPKTLRDLNDEVEKLTAAIGGNLDAIKAAEDEEMRQKLEDEQREAHKQAVDKAKASVKTVEPRLKKMNAELKKLEKAAEKAKDVEKKKLESDIELLKPKIQDSISELEIANEITGSAFQFNPQESLPSSKAKDNKTHKFLGDTRDSKLNIKIPKEGLPEFGTLLRDGNTRYLAVTDWEHIAQGKSDAKRLNATLCASKEILE